MTKLSFSSERRLLRNCPQPPETSRFAGPFPLPPEAGPSLLRSRGWLRAGEGTAASASQEFNNFCEDAIEFLRKIPEGAYDMIIVDPPAFAKHRGALKNALRAYQRLNASAIAKVAPGGLVFTFSCSQVVDKITFANTVFSAAAQTGPAKGPRPASSTPQRGLIPLSRISFSIAQRSIPFSPPAAAPGRSSPAFPRGIRSAARLPYAQCPPLRRRRESRAFFRRPPKAQSRFSPGPVQIYSVRRWPAAGWPVAAA